MGIIKKFGKGLTGINLLMKGFGHHCLMAIIEGCPKLKTLTLEPFQEPQSGSLWLVTVGSLSLEALSKGCKDLKDLKITKGCFADLAESEIRPILPNCNVEMKECWFDDACGDDFIGGICRIRIGNYHYYSDVFNYFKGGEIELMFTTEYGDILDNFNGGELELMFTHNYDEDIKDENGN